MSTIKKISDLLGLEIKQLSKERSRIPTILYDDNYSINVEPEQIVLVNDTQIINGLAFEPDYDIKGDYITLADVLLAISQRLVQVESTLKQMNQ